MIPDDIVDIIMQTIARAVRDHLITDSEYLAVFNWLDSQQGA